MGTYLVTGGAGFIGSHIVDALVERGDRVRVLDDLSGGSRENLERHALGACASGSAVELLVGDVADAAVCARGVEGVDGIFHEAAQVSVPASLDAPGESYRINVTGTLNILEAARAAGVRRVVFAASSAAYGDGEESPKHEALAPRPLSPYASGKMAGERLLEVYARSFAFQTAALRYFNVYGPRQSDDSPYSGVIALFAQRLLAGEGVTIHGDGQQTRDFVHVSDVARANLAAMDRGLEPGQVVNVGTGRALSLIELHSIMAGLCGAESPPQHGPARAGDIRHSVAAVERARECLAWEAKIGAEEGLALTLDWYRGR